MKKYFILFLALFFGAFILYSTQNVLADTVPDGSLIKGSGSAVYYYADNVRHAFSNFKVYSTWYDNFDNVRIISDNELAKIPLASNVVYRPGLKMVKITTSPEVYAVASGGVLRHVANELVAKELYGEDWAKKVNDIPDAFFVDYKIGEEIVKASDFNIVAIMDAVTTIANNKENLFIDNYDKEAEESLNFDLVDFTVSPDVVYPGDNITLRASIKDGIQVSKIDLFYNYELISSCENASNCQVSTVASNTFDESEYLAKVIVTRIDGTNFNVTKVVEAGNNNNVDNYSDLVSLESTQTVIRTGETLDMEVKTHDISDIRRINIYINSVKEKIFDNVQECTFVKTFNGNVGDIFDVQAVVEKINGRKYYSVPVRITISDTDAPVLSFMTEKSFIYPGETMVLTAVASDDDGIKSISILDTDNNVLKTCENVVKCEVEVGSWMDVGEYSFKAGAVDVLNTAMEKSLKVIVKNP